MTWIKQGLIFEPPRNRPWMVSHAALPVAQPSGGSEWRVYFSGRDAKGRGQIGWFEIDLAQPERTLRVSHAPSIALGPLGAFDDNGVTSSWITQHAGRQYQYYTGWTLGVTVPFYFYIGLAISDDGGETWRKVSPAPILERNAVDPFLTASPCVLIDNGVWRMWYVACLRWELEQGQPKHYYHIRYAESHNGIEWQRTGLVCVDFEAADEYAFARPCVLKENGIYRMWYAVRGARYRIGYAESRDGLRWERKDAEVGLEPSPEGWDSEMLAYPFVFDHGGKRYMLYNGNEYGKTGIGLAVAVDADD